MNKGPELGDWSKGSGEWRVKDLEMKDWIRNMLPLCLHVFVLVTYTLYGGYLVGYYHLNKSEFYLKARGITMLLIYGKSRERVTQRDMDG